ncbi:MAG: MASE1 domain-containing protein [Gemmatimonadaceae bacterium]|nr:MASE1 domain-containing protein [Gemmatimonadaceae bacterium]
MALNAAVAAIYTAVGQVSLAAATEHRAISSLWMPAGVALFALVRFGPRLWPGVALGAFLLNKSVGIPVAGALAIAGGDALEAVIGAHLVLRVWTTRTGPRNLRDVAALAVLAGAVSTAVAATIGVGTLVLIHATTLATAPALWLVWWTGDAVGVLVMSPFLFAWSHREEPAQQYRSRRIEVVLAFVGLAVTTDVLFARWGMLSFAVFPLVGWIALRLRLRGASTAVIIVTLVASLRTLAGYGPFTTLSPTGNLFALQLFLVLLAIKSLSFAALQYEARASAERVRQSEALYRMLAQHLPDGCVVLFDDALRLLLVEGPAVAAAGFVKEEVEGCTLDEIFDPAHAAALVQPFGEALRGHELEFEFGYREKTYLVRVLPLAERPAGGASAMALALDVTARAAAQRELAESRARLERLSRLLLTAQENERRRIAREVHDELGQALTAVKIGLATSLQRAQHRGSLDSERHVRTAAATVDQAIESVQRIILALRPGVLDNLGPIAAIEHAVQQFSERSGIAVSLELLPEPLQINAEHATALYRTVQEALTNVLRHADARTVTVSLRADAQDLHLHIADDGRGIGDDQLRNPRSMGILGMRERAAACGGSLNLSRAPGGGTVVSMSMPRHPATSTRHSL